MSSPIDRSSDQDEVLHYAPKWARDRESVSRRRAGKQPPMAGGEEASRVLADSADFESELFRFPGSLEPTPVPEPPMSKPWRFQRARTLVGGGGGASAFFPFFFAVFLAALIAFVLVMDSPKIQSFVTKQRPSATFGARFDGDPPRPLAKSWTAVIEPAATAPIVHQSPVRPTQSAVATPATPNPAPAASISAPGATSVKTVPVQSEKTVRSLGPDEIKTLLKQGEDFVSVGDFASARLVFRRVWEANEARGALALAATYDPIVLASIGVKGATADVAKAREWYLKAQELGLPDVAPQLEALASRNFVILAQKSAAMALAGKEAPIEAASQNSLPGEVPAPAGSYWKHGGSIMRLEAIGNSRKFFYYRPSDAELQAGAKVGSLRFDGQISGKGYIGTAFFYSDKCGRSPFPVSGQIENNNGRVILLGKSLHVDGDCQEIGSTDEKLIFDFMETRSE